MPHSHHDVVLLGPRIEAPSPSHNGSTDPQHPLKPAVNDSAPANDSTKQQQRLPSGSNHSTALPVFKSINDSSKSDLPSSTPLNSTAANSTVTKGDAAKANSTTAHNATAANSTMNDPTPLSDVKNKTMPLPITPDPVVGSNSTKPIANATTIADPDPPLAHNATSPDDKTVDQLSKERDDAGGQQHNPYLTQHPASS